MTPTLQGRWQTRFYLLSTLGALISLLFGAFYDDYQTPLILLVYVFLIGVLWDILYNYLQTLRWDRDWPPIFLFSISLSKGYCSGSSSNFLDYGGFLTVKLRLVLGVA